jgi:hypothetical protein
MLENSHILPQKAPRGVKATSNSAMADRRRAEP